MTWLRRLVLPAVLSAASFGPVVGLILRGADYRPELPHLRDMVWPSFFGIVGILIVGLPAAHWLSGAQVSPAVRVLALVAIGAAGGAAIAAVLFRSVQIGLLGIASGAVTALIWTMFNIDMVNTSPPQGGREQKDGSLG